MGEFLEDSSVSELAELGAAVAFAETPSDAAEDVARGLCRHAGFDLACALLAAPQNDPVLHLHSKTPVPEGVLTELRDRSIETFIRHSGRDINEHWLSVRVSGDTPGHPTEPLPPDGVRTIELARDGRVLGVLVCGTRSGSTPADEAHLRFAADRIASGLHRLHERRSRNRDWLDRIVMPMHEGFVFVESGVEEVLLNQAARRSLGFSSDEPVEKMALSQALGFSILELCARQEHQDVFTKPVELAGRKKDVAIHALRSKSGALTSAVALLRAPGSGTNAKEREAFLATLSHELRTPLTGLLGALDIALGASDDKREQYLALAQGTGLRLNQLVDNLLDVARSEHQRLPLRLVPLSLDAVTREAVARHQPLAEARQMSIEARQGESSIRITGDADRLAQALDQLLHVALDRANPGASIVVEAYGPTVTRDQVGVSVSAPGRPIPAATLARVFGRGSDAADDAFVELALAKAIVEAHGGRMWVDASNGQNRFVCTLPKAHRTAAGTRPPTATPEPTARGLVLVVDDNHKSTSFFRSMALADGHIVREAGDAEEALSIARRERPQVVVVNSTLSGGEALSLVGILKHDPDTHRARVLVVSDATPRDEVLRAGADDVLLTPVAPKRFRSAVNRLVADGATGPARVLVIDDDPAIRMVCREVLESAGYSVRECESGHEALLEAQRTRPHLILVDINMPDCDGFATVEQLRQSQLLHMTPVIFLSARSDTSSKIRAFRLGAEDYIQKPFIGDELCARVVKALERHESAIGASPTTQLPGANVIQSAIEKRIARGNDAAYCYLDLDNFKAFNDHYGYARADGVIRQIGDLIRNTVGRHGGAEDFIGHIAGDDFVVLTDVERVDDICSHICAAFDRMAPLYYNKRDRDRGYIETEDRYGTLRQFPILALSISAVTTDSNHLDGYAQLAELAATGKKLAKSVPVSSYVRDDHIVIG